MALTDPGLWRRLEAFELSPPGSVFGFASRLARENRWSRPHVQAVLAEYRRFLYLCAVAGRALTPPDAVEQAWRLHLDHPRAYAELCRGVLGRRLRPAPTGEQTAAAALREAGYRETLAAYGREFGTAPPAAIWPVADLECGRADTIRLLDPR